MVIVIHSFLSFLGKVNQQTKASFVGATILELQLSRNRIIAEPNVPNKSRWAVGDAVYLQLGRQCNGRAKAATVNLFQENQIFKFS